MRECCCFEYQPNIKCGIELCMLSFLVRRRCRLYSHGTKIETKIHSVMGTKPKKTTLLLLDKSSNESYLKMPFENIALKHLLASYLVGCFIEMRAFHSRISFCR